MSEENTRTRFLIFMIDLSVDLKDQKWEKLPTNKIGKNRQLNTFQNNLHHFFLMEGLIILLRSGKNGLTSVL